MNQYLGKLNVIHNNSNFKRFHFSTLIEFTKQNYKISVKGCFSNKIELILFCY